jgi:hypothetical protein
LGSDQTTAPGIDGTETNTTQATDGTETPSTEGGDESDPIKNIQKLTGKLAQKIRDTEEQLNDKDIKYTLNSIISAMNIGKLSDEDKTDVINKLEGKDDETSAEIPMSENEDETIDVESNFYENLLNDKTVIHIINMADLNYEMSNNPSEIAFDFCEAAYVFIHDYNDKTEFIMKLKSLLIDNQFKARPNLQSKNDLEYFGDILYDAMVKHETQHDGEVLEQDNTIARFTASGGQTVGENKLNEQILSILQRAKQNVKNNLNK